MNTLVIDIETIPMDFNTELDEVQRNIVLKKCTTPEEIATTINSGGLNPFTGRICCIGLYSLEKKKGTALYLNDRDNPTKISSEYDGSEFVLSSKLTETDILTSFWNYVKRKDEQPYHIHRMITFNGRNFDMPFIMLRSVLLGISPTVNLMAGTKWNPRIDFDNGNYNNVPHFDLAEILTFYNASYKSEGPLRRWSLDMYTRSFGIKSPKSENASGDQVSKMFAEGKHSDIAEYCLRDVKATGELFEKCLANSLIN